MSAWMCSKTHLAVIVRAGQAVDYDAARVRISNPAGETQYRTLYLRDEEAEAEALRILYRANVRSLEERYPEHFSEMIGYEEEELAPLARFSGPIPAVVALKACNCYDYQACEAEGYEQSDAAWLVNSIRRSVIHRLPGYEEAPWSVDEWPIRKETAAR